MPLWCDLYIKIEHDKFEWRSPHENFKFSSHADEQFRDWVPQHLRDNTSMIVKPACPWRIKTPPGWSCLFVPPLNREEKNIELISGIVDTDIFHEYVNFPGFIIPNDIEYLKLELGYPLIQVIPFRRGFNKDAKISTLSSEDIACMEKKRQTRSTRNASLYRDENWNKK